jgi:hypothetical protein
LLLSTAPQTGRRHSKCLLRTEVASPSSCVHIQISQVSINLHHVMVSCLRHWIRDLICNPPRIKLSSISKCSLDLIYHSLLFCLWESAPLNSSCKVGGDNVPNGALCPSVASSVGIPSSANVIRGSFRSRWPRWPPWRAFRLRTKTATTPS